MKVIVDYPQRYAKMRAHTATHLLHAQLAKIFPTTKQAGSLVDDDVVRFDFVADRLLTQEEIAKIEKRINQIIYLAADVVSEEMPIADAMKLGAKAFFEDKYGGVVRVVRVINNSLPEAFHHDDNEEYFSSFGDFLSLELCGGTHVSNTRDIGCFAIVWQEAVASGVKRISAVTGPNVYYRISEVQGILDSTVAKLGIKTASQLGDKLDKVMNEYADMKSALEGIEATTVKHILQGNDFASGRDIDKIFIVPSYINFKNILGHAKGVFTKELVLIYSAEGNFLIISPESISAKDVAIRLWLKWWGNDRVVQGRDENVLTLFT